MTPANICFVLLVFICPALAINCFQCSSYEHPECADIQANETDSPFLHRCEPRGNYQMFCRKIVQKIKDQPDFVRITRTCGWYVFKTNTSNCQITDTDFKAETVCQCFTDACNGGATATSVVAIVSMGILGMLLR